MYTFNKKQKLVGLLAGLIVVGTSPLVCVAQRPPSRAMSSSLSHAKAALPSVSSASRVNTPAVMQPQLGVAAVQGSRSSSRPGANWPANQSVKASRPGATNPRLHPLKPLTPSVVKAQPLLPPRQALPNRVTSNRNQGTRVGGGQPVVSAVRPGAIGGPIIRPSELRPKINPGSQPILTQTRPTGNRPLPWRGNPILPDRMASSSQPLGTEYVPKRNLSLGPANTGGSPLPGPLPWTEPSDDIADKRPTTSSVVLPSNIISITKSNSDDGRYDSSKLEPAPKLLIPSGAPLRQETPKPPQVKNVPVKGPLKVISQVLLQRRDGVFLRRILVDMTEGHETGYVLTEELSRQDTEKFADSLEKGNPKHVIIRTLDGTLYDDSDSGNWIAFGNPKAPFFYWPKGTVDAADLKGPLAPFDSPAADIIPGGRYPDGFPNHQQGDGNGNSNPGPNPGGPPVGTNKPDKGGIVGHPSEQPGGDDNGSGQGQEDMGPMPPAGETTVEVENEYGPPPEDSPKSPWGGMTDDQYEQLRGCLIYGCPDEKSSEDSGSGSGSGSQGNTESGGDDSGSSGSDDGNSSSDNDSSDDDDKNSSSGSGDDSDSSDSGYTPGADASGGDQPAGAEELKYALFQTLGYLFHSRNFGPRFPLVGDPRPETGGPENNQNGPQGTAQLDPSTFPSGKKNKTGSNKDVLVNGDLRKKTSPAGPDKATAEDGFSDQFLRTFEVIDPVPIEK